jgi:hypothetical protein
MKKILQLVTTTTIKPPSGNVYMKITKEMLAELTA